MAKKNYFLNPKLSSHYDLARPSFHHEALKAYHREEARVLYDRILDVGCGTGKASLALAEWSREVIGVDSSQAMLGMAAPNEKVKYILGEAENLPITEAQFDIIFVSSSFHWFERRKFFKEVDRLLRPQGKLLIYDSFLLKGLSPDFSRLFSERFPRPYEDAPINELELDFFNLKLTGTYLFDIERSFRRDDVINYFMTLSNVAWAMEKGEKIERIKKDIEELIEKQSSGSPYEFQVQLIEITKK